jgi:nicotinamide mononucleotide (NMN) deamidase PncC
MVSMRKEQIVAVTKVLKKRILDKLQNEDQVSPEIARRMVTDAFNEVANDLGISVQSVQSKCCTQLGNIGTDDFFKLAKDYITRASTDLEELTVKTGNTRDSEQGIRAAFKAV